MTLVSVGLLMVASTVVLHTEESRDLPLDQVSELIGTLSSAVERRCGSGVAVQPFDPRATCDDREACLGKIIATTDARELVAVRILAVPSKIRVIAELRDRHLRVVRRAQVDVARDQAEWAASLDAVALALYPLAPRRPSDLGDGPAQPTTPEPQVVDVALGPEPAPSRWPWWLIGGGAVAGGVAIALGVENASAREEGVRPGLSRERVEDLRDTTRATGLGANVLFGVAATSLITGSIFLALGE